MSAEHMLAALRFNRWIAAWAAIGKAYALPYNVDLWGSDPDDPANEGNDDCWTGESYATKEEAVAAYRSVVMFPDADPLVRVCGRGGWAYVVIDGPDLHESTPNPDRAAVRRHRREMDASSREWKRERAMQAGMAFGCDGHNDEMGW